MLELASMGRPRMLAALGVTAAALLPAAASAVTGYFSASASARLSDGTSVIHEVPNQAQAANAAVYSGTWSAGAIADTGAPGGQAIASALVPAPPEHRDDVYALGAGSQGGMGYSFHLAGANTGERIPVSILGKASVQWLGYGTGYASIWLSGESGDDALHMGWEASDKGTQAGGVIVDADETLYLLAGVEYDVQLFARAYAYAFGADPDGPSSYALASADPVFTVLGDYAARYTLVGVPGMEVGPPSSSVPEPASWSLVLGGLALLVGAPRGRRPRTGGPR